MNDHSVRMRKQIERDVANFCEYKLQFCIKTALEHKMEDKLFKEIRNQFEIKSLCWQLMVDLYPKK